MKKATLITGISVAFILLLATMLKLLHIPGASALLVLGVFLLNIAYSPLLLIYNMRNTSTPVFLKVSQVIGLFAGWGLAVGALFTLQSWPGAEFNLIIGAMGVFVFSLLYIIAQTQYKTEEKKLNVFTYLTVFHYALLVLCLVAIKPTKKIREEYVIQDQKLNLPLKSAYEKNKVLYGKLISVWQTWSFLHTSHSDTLECPMKEAMTGASDLEYNTRDLIRYLHLVRGTLISHSEGLAETMCELLEMENIRHVTDYDVPTHYLIGSNPAEPTGESLELKSRLDAYKTEILKIAHSTSLPTGLDTGPITDTEGKTKPWIIVNFYHTELGQTLLIFKSLETRIKKAEGVVLEEMIRQGKKNG